VNQEDDNDEEAEESPSTNGGNEEDELKNDLSDCSEEGDYVVVTLPSRIKKKVVANIEQKGFYFYCGNRCWETVPKEPSFDKDVSLGELDKLLTVREKKKNVQPKKVFIFFVFMYTFRRSYFLLLFLLLFWKWKIQKKKKSH
jgi:hypothetical protein